MPNKGNEILIFNKSIYFYQNTFLEMANHKSAKKRVRQDAKIRLHNRFYKKSARSAIKTLRELDNQGDAAKFLPKVASMLDRLAKNNQIHKNKANNLKASLAKHVNRLGK